MRLQPALVGRLWNTAAVRFAPRARKELSLLVVFVAWLTAAPVSALTVTGISATANCDAVTGVTVSGAGSATITDGNGILIAAVSLNGPFIPLEQPANNTQWTVTGGTPSTITPSNFAPQCAPPLLTVSAGNFNARIMQGGLGAPPSGSYTVGNAGGSQIDLPATPYFPNGVRFFNLSTLSTLGPGASSIVTVTLNSAAFSLPPGRYTASIDFSNAANLSLVATRQVLLTVVRSVSHDFNRDGFGDIGWRNGNGDVVIWEMIGTQVSNPSASFVANVPFPLWTIIGTGDFNGDGYADFLWRDTGGNTAMWFLHGTQVTSSQGVGNIATTWMVVGTADFNGDGMGDILWRDNSGNLATWLMNGATVTSASGLGNVALTWAVVGTGDYNGDGKSDLLWRDGSGNTAIWFMNGAMVSSSAGVGNIPPVWSVAGTGDFDGDGKSDIVWRDNNGNTSIWLMNGAAVVSAVGLGTVPALWSIVQIGDYNGDGKSDLMWRDDIGNTSIWFMKGAAVSSTAGLGNIPTIWTVQSTNAE